MKSLRIASLFILCMAMTLALSVGVAYAAEDADVGATIYITEDVQYDENGNTIIHSDTKLNDAKLNGGGTMSPYADPFQTYYKVKNKTLKKTYNEITEYLTPGWAKSEKYIHGYSKTYATQIQISGTKEFVSGIRLTGAFTYSVSKTYSVSTTIPADATRWSKLVRTTDFKQYACDLYSYRTNGIQALPDVFVSSGTVNEPQDTYLSVYYK